MATFVALLALSSLALAPSVGAGISIGAQLTVVKVTDPASDPQDFDFDLTGAGVTADLDLDTDAGDATLPTQQTFFLGAAQLGAHTVIESAVAGWSLTGLVCTGAGDDSSTNPGTRTAALDIDAGENIVCTFTNTKHASLTVDKVTDPASDPQDFDFDLTGSGLPPDLDLDTDAGNATLPTQQTFALNAAQLGAHTVAESLTFGWTLTALECTGAGSDSSTSLVTRTATLDIDPGENVVCTFTNTKHASYTVVKVTDPASDPQDFDFDLTGPDSGPDLDLDTDAGDATLPSQQVFLINAAHLGAHTITESLVSGWTLTGLECLGAGADSSTNLGTRTATLDIDAGENIVCTFTNSLGGASLTIVKVTDPASDPQDFDFDLTGAGVPADSDLDTDAGNATLPTQETFAMTGAQLGAHTVVENTPAGWTLTGLVCTGAGDDSSTSLLTRTATLDIDAGETVVCTFTNTKHASLTIVKETSPASDPQDFDFDLSGAGVPADIDLDTDAGDAGVPSSHSFPLDASELGAHSITESALAGWVLTDLECTGAGADSSTSFATRTATLDIDPGENVVCTFTNLKANSTVTIIKVTDPSSDPQDFDFNLLGGGLPADLDLDTDGGDGTLPSQQTFDVSAEGGAYQLIESATAGWILTDLTCTGAGDDGSINLATRTANLDLDVGEDAICTFTNTKAAALLTITKVTVPASDPQDFYIDVPPIGNTSLDTDPASIDIPASETFKLIDSQLGERTATETVPAGWSLTAIDCTGDAGAAVDLANERVVLDIDAGETIACTFTNTKDTPASPVPSGPELTPELTDDVDATGDTIPTVPGTDTLGETPATAGFNVVLAIAALALLSGVALAMRPKREHR